MTAQCFYKMYLEVWIDHTESQRLQGTVLPAGCGGIVVAGSVRGVPAAVPSPLSCTVLGYTYTVCMAKAVSVFWCFGDCRSRTLKVWLPSISCWSDQG